MILKGLSGATGKTLGERLENIPDTWIAVIIWLISFVAWVCLILMRPQTDLSWLEKTADLALGAVIMGIRARTRIRRSNGNSGDDVISASGSDG